MDRRRVYISCVSAEFGNARRALADFLVAAGHEVFFQEIPAGGVGDLRPHLAGVVESCHDLIQIVGEVYGPEPPSTGGQAPRVSYAQFEFLHAQTLRKNLCVFLATEGFASDFPRESLDMPADPGNVDPLAFQSERRQLQAAYRDSIVSPAVALRQVGSASEVLAAAKVLFQAAKRRRKRWLVAAAAAAVVLVFGFVVLVSAMVAVNQARKRARPGPVASQLVGRKVSDKEKALAARLEQALKATHQDTCAAAANLPRDTFCALVAGADKELEERLKLVDDLTTFLAIPRGSAASVASLDKLAKLILDEGVDAGIEWAEDNYDSLVQAAKAESNPQERRAKLNPLLASAALLAIRNRDEDSESVYADLEKLEPDWIDLHTIHFWDLNTETDVAIAEGRSADAREIADWQLAIAKRMVAISPSDPRCQRAHAVAFGTIADVERAQGLYLPSISSDRAAIAVLDEALKARPGNPDWYHLSSMYHDRVGFSQERLDDSVGAAASYRTSIDLRKRLVELSPDDYTDVSNLAFTQVRLAGVEDRLGHPRQALELFRAGEEGLEKCIALRPGEMGLYRSAWRASSGLAGAASELGDAKARQAAIAKSLSIAQDMVEVMPNDPNAWATLASSQGLVGDLLSSAKRETESTKHYSEAAVSMAKAVKLDPGNREYELLAAAVKYRAIMFTPASEAAKAEARHEVAKVVRAIKAEKGNLSSASVQLLAGIGLPY